MPPIVSPLLKSLPWFLSAIEVPGLFCPPDSVSTIVHPPVECTHRKVNLSTIDQQHQPEAVGENATLKRRIGCCHAGRSTNVATADLSVLTDNKLKWGLFSNWHWQPKCCKSRRWSTPRNTSNEFGFISLQGTFISLKLVKPLQHQLISRYQFQSLHDKSLTWQ